MERLPQAATSRWTPEATDLSTAVQRAQSGDQDAFRLLYRDLQPRVVRYLTALVGADAEDVASETWLQVARDLGRFRGGLDDFRGWVTTISRNRATDHARRASRRPTPAPVPVEELAWLAGEEDTADRAIDAMATDAAIALIATLPPDQAEAVLLRVVVGLDAKTAGRVLGKRPGAVRTSAYRGLHKLAEQLSEAGSGSGPGEPALTKVTPGWHAQ